MVGHAAANTLAPVYVDLAVIGRHGFAPDVIPMDLDRQKVAINRTAGIVTVISLIENSNEPGMNESLI